MLETIQAFIDSIEDIPFSEYYNEYVMRMAEMSLANEFEYLLNYNSELDVLKIDALISKYMHELVTIDG